MKDGILPTFSDPNSSDTLSTKCLGELTRGLMSLNSSPEMLTSWFQKIFLLFFNVSLRANDPLVTRCDGNQFELQGHGW